MSHVDEGLIHAWLDGQLPPDEAERVQHLVETDPEWASAVAEARGLIAGAARIVSALDDVPAVLPLNSRASGTAKAEHAAVRPSVLRTPWLRAAAGVVLVAGVASVVWQRMPGPVDPTERAMELVVTADTAPVADATVQAAQASALRDTAGLRDTAELRQRKAAAEPPVQPPAAADARSLMMRAERTATAGRASAAGGGRGAAGGVMGGAAGAQPGAAVGTRERTDQAADLAGVGCWEQINVPVPAADTGRVVEARERDVAGLMLRFMDPVVTDMITQRPSVRAPLPAGVRRAVSRAPLANAAYRMLDDSSYVAEWIEERGRTALTFSVVGDTLRGTTRLSAGGIEYPMLPFTAVRVVCPE